VQHTSSGRRVLAAIAVATLVTLAVETPARAESRQIDAEHSTLTVFVYKSGLFSALADNHVIAAPVAGGSVSDEAPLAVEMSVRSADLKVLDPDTSASRRAEVQARMQGADVLDVATYPEITFSSTSIDAMGTNRWNVTGRLTIHGQTRTITVATVLEGGRYRGSVLVKQREFGIRPISIAGGAVKVKDELKIQFDVAVR